MDRVWSLCPAAYALLFAALAPSPRAALMAALATLWAARLTYNFARKGGFSKIEAANEDYRWPVLRGWFAAALPPALLVPAREAFHLLFVCAYQNVLLYLIVVPACVAVAARGAALGLAPADGLLAAGFLLLLAGEAVTDEQQWAFQARKHALSPKARQAAGGDLARGFLTTGVFAYSRHLNFACEQGLWVAFYGFAVVARAPGGDVAALVRAQGAGALLTPAALGPALLMMLFQGSTWMTEVITAEK